MSGNALREDGKTDEREKLHRCEFLCGVGGNLGLGFYSFPCPGRRAFGCIGSFTGKFLMFDWFFRVSNSSGPVTER